MELYLWFQSAPRPELVQVRFMHADAAPRISYRGKILMHEKDAGLFQWSSAVKAFAELAVGTRAWVANDKKGEPFALSGEANSKAASLDFAISKPTSWIVDLFGREISEKSVAKVVFKRENSERKLPGPVRIFLNSALFSGGTLKIFLDGVELQNAQALKQLFISLEQESSPDLKQNKQTNLFDAAWFRTILYQEIRYSLEETNLFEEATIDLSAKRLGASYPSHVAKIRRIASLLKKQLPPVASRYTSKKSISKELRKKKFKIACPPTAVSTLCLFHFIRSLQGENFEIYSNFPSTNAILESDEATSFDAFVLSWGASVKLLKSSAFKSYVPIMLLPRTSIDLVSLLPADRISSIKKVLLSQDPLGYPIQYFNLLKDNKILSSRCKAIPGSFAEIVSFLTEKAEAGILGFPISHFAAKRHEAHLLKPQCINAGVGDNVLFVRDNKEAIKLSEDIRAAWFTLLEDPSRREKAANLIFSDLSFVNYLYRLAALYR